MPKPPKDKREIGKKSDRIGIPDCFGKFDLQKYKEVCKKWCVHGVSGDGGCIAYADYIRESGLDGI